MVERSRFEKVSNAEVLSRAIRRLRSVQNDIIVHRDEEKRARASAEHCEAKIDELQAAAQIAAGIFRSSPDGYTEVEI